MGRVVRRGVALVSGLVSRLAVRTWLVVALVAGGVCGVAAVLAILAREACE